MRGVVGSQMKVEFNVSTCASEEKNVKNVKKTWEKKRLERLRSTGRSAEADNLEAHEHKRRGRMVGVAPYEPSFRRPSVLLIRVTSTPTLRR